MKTKELYEVKKLCEAECPPEGHSAKHSEDPGFGKRWHWCDKLAGHRGKHSCPEFPRHKW